MDFFNSSKTHILFNPRLPEGEKEIWNALPLKGHFEDHIWVATSGTSGRIKFAALSKKGILLSAQAVNAHLNSDASDIWLHGLPDFHVGGLGIWARALLSGAAVVDCKTQHEKWEPKLFCRMLQETRSTLTALVPTQIYDFVFHQLQAPPSLRAVIVGGGGINPHLHVQALKLGWPMLPSYGLTECASQVATAKENGELGTGIVLPHVTVKIDAQQFIWLKSPSLLTAYGVVENGKLRIHDPKEEGWFKTEDKGALKGHLLRFFGRSTDFVKIGGESCSLIYLRTLLEELKITGVDVALTATPDERLGNIIHLFSEECESADLQHLVNAFNSKAMPFERIRKITFVKKIPRTSLGKILYGELRACDGDRLGKV